MNLSMHIPDDLAQRLNAGGDLARRALEAFAADEYRAGRLTSPELRRLLGFETGVALDAFLKARGVSEPNAVGDHEQDQPNLAEAIRRRFAPIGGVDDLVIPPREPAREPPRFDR